MQPLAGQATLQSRGAAGTSPADLLRRRFASRAAAQPLPVKQPQWARKVRSGSQESSSAAPGGVGVRRSSRTAAAAAAAVAGATDGDAVLDRGWGERAPRTPVQARKRAHCSCVAEPAAKRERRSSGNGSPVVAAAAEFAVGVITAVGMLLRSATRARRS